MKRCDVNFFFVTLQYNNIKCEILLFLDKISLKKKVASPCPDGLAWFVVRRDFPDAELIACNFKNATLESIGKHRKERHVWDLELGGNQCVHHLRRLTRKIQKITLSQRDLVCSRQPPLG